MKCKADSFTTSEEPIINHLMLSFPSIESAIQTSCLAFPQLSLEEQLHGSSEDALQGGKNVIEAFYFAQKAVLFPVSPLLERDHLNEGAERALAGIYSVISLENNDGDVLKDEQLNKFQEYCFGNGLSKEEMENVKQVVRDNCPEGLTNDKINLAGRDNKRIRVRLLVLAKSVDREGETGSDMDCFAEIWLQSTI